MDLLGFTREAKLGDEDSANLPECHYCVSGSMVAPRRILGWIPCPAALMQQMLILRKNVASTLRGWKQIAMRTQKEKDYFRRKDFLKNIFRERGREEESNIDMREISTGRPLQAPPTRDRAQSPQPRHLCLQDAAQPTEPHWPGWWTFLKQSKLPGDRLCSFPSSFSWNCPNFSLLFWPCLPWFVAFSISLTVLWVVGNFAFSMQFSAFCCTKFVYIFTVSEAQNLQCSSGFREYNAERHYVDRDDR